MSPADDDDDWVGTPPEGHYTRDRAKPEFWWRQKPIVPAFVGIFLVVVVILLVVLLSCRPGSGVPRRRRSRGRRATSESVALGPGGSRPSVDSHEPAMMSSRPAIAPAPGRSPRTATPSATATTGAT